MKNLLFISLLLIMSSGYSIAQFNKHDVKLGLQLHPYHNEHDTPIYQGAAFSHNKSHGIDIMPEIGWFISDKTELGIGAGFSWYKDSNSFDSLLERHGDGRSLNFTVYGRRYFSLNEKVALFLSGSINYSRGISHSDIMYYSPVSEYRTDYNITGYAIGIAPGLSYFPVKKIQLSTSFGNLSFSRNNTHSKTDNTDSISRTYGLNVSLNSLSFGIHYFL